MTPQLDGADPDPVVARYSVFLKPQLPAHQKLLVLQYPNRAADKTAPGAASGNSSTVPQTTPSELRIKPSAGMVEVDVPLDYSSAYDRAKGVAWGSALAASTKAKAGGSHGLAGGFGVGGPQAGGRGGARAGQPGPPPVADPSDSAAYPGPSVAAPTPSAEWSEALRQDRVLRKQTLGGMAPPSRITEARWMIGVFDGDNLHLTPVTSMVHLRPQLHHIDAETEVERAKHRDAGGGGGGGGSAGAADASGQGGAAVGAGASGSSFGGNPRAGPSAGLGPGGAPRAIHMTVKSVGPDGDEVITETMADRLRAVQMENWTRMQYVGDDDERSWDTYDRTLFLRNHAVPAADRTTAADPAAGPSTRLAAAVPALHTAWTEADMLQALSKMEKPPGADEDAYGGDAASTPAASRALLPTPQPAAAGRGTATARAKGKGRATAGDATPAAAAAAAAPPSAGAVAVKSEQQEARPAVPLAPRTAAAAGSASTRPPARTPSTSTRTRGGRARQAGPSSTMDLD